ncbi:MAG TPA: hypothetical protein VH107_19835 [Lacipirellulaceae bacterium]|nr:hypothetical protein [Lacipirellulaceae bacterium]
MRPNLERAATSARESGTPFLSCFKPEEMKALAREVGFRDVEHVSAVDLTERYFVGREDGLGPPKNCEEFLVGRT